jgi:hypothetical protein
MSRGGSQLTELIRHIAVGALQHVQMKFELGELTDYDPATNRGKFTLPMVRDATDTEQETGFLPIGTLFTGVAYGMQFPPAVGNQAVILFLDHAGSVPIAAIFLNNDMETPPFPDGKSMGWLDTQGNTFKTTVDGKDSGDGAGGARAIGASYASVVAPLIELGMEDLTFPDQGVVRQEDLQSVVDQMNTFIGIFNAHVHPGVVSGASSTSPSATLGTDITEAQASTTVGAND